VDVIAVRDGAVQGSISPAGMSDDHRRLSQPERSSDNSSRRAGGNDSWQEDPRARSSWLPGGWMRAASIRSSPPHGTTFEEGVKPPRRAV
jgi:hypothetical protein